MDAEDPDRAAILRRRARWIALALAAATSGAGLIGPAEAQDDAATEADGGAVDDAGPLPCLSRPRGGCG